MGSLEQEGPTSVASIVHVVVPQVFAATLTAAASEVARGLSVRVVLALIRCHAIQTLLTGSFVPVGIITLLRLVLMHMVVIVSVVFWCHYFWVLECFVGFDGFALTLKLDVKVEQGAVVIGTASGHLAVGTKV
jgi:uncharacterized membrane protein YjfL (UPF0719 family)